MGLEDSLIRWELRKLVTKLGLPAAKPRPQLPYGPAAASITYGASDRDWMEDNRELLIGLLEELTE